jgi:hypothetical protein
VSHPSCGTISRRSTPAAHTAVRDANVQHDVTVPELRPSRRQRAAATECDAQGPIGTQLRADIPSAQSQAVGPSSSKRSSRCGDGTNERDAGVKGVRMKLSTLLERASTSTSMEGWRTSRPLPRQPQRRGGIADADQLSLKLLLSISRRDNPGLPVRPSTVQSSDDLHRLTRTNPCRKRL